MEINAHERINEDDRNLCKLAISELGNVGENAARLLHERGYKVIAVSDSKGGILSQKGLDIKTVMEHKEKTGKCRGRGGKLFRMDTES